MATSAWLKQRTRWMKGWMQTFIVHNRRPGEFLREVGWRGAYRLPDLCRQHDRLGAAAQRLRRLVPRQPVLPRGPLDIWDAASWAIFALGYGGPFALVIAGLVRLKRFDLLAAQLLLPVLLAAAPRSPRCVRWASC